MCKISSTKFHAHATLYGLNDKLFHVHKTFKTKFQTQEINYSRNTSPDLHHDMGPGREWLPSPETSGSWSWLKDMDDSWNIPVLSHKRYATWLKDKIRQFSTTLSCATANSLSFSNLTKHWRKKPTDIKIRVGKRVNDAKNLYLC